MRLTPLPVFATLRDLWSRPRDMARFREYLGRLADAPTGVVVAPLVAANPMARPHMLQFLDTLEALGAETRLGEACDEASGRLAPSPLEAFVSLVPVDDVGGAWSDKTSTDFAARFGPARTARRARRPDEGYVTALVFASERPTPATIRERVLAAAYRASHTHRHGPPRSIRAMLAQEGRALRFAGIAPGGALRADLEAGIAPHLDRTDDPARFAAMYGDGAARRLGYPPLGVAENGGFSLALARAQAEGPPESWV